GGDRLALELVGPSDDGRFRDGGMADQRAFHFHRAETMPGDVHDVVDAAHDPEVAVRVAPGAVAGEVRRFDLAPVLLHVALRVPVDRAQHAGPGFLHHQIAALVVADRLPFAGDDIHLDAG